MKGIHVYSLECEKCIDSQHHIITPYVTMEARDALIGKILGDKNNQTNQFCVHTAAVIISQPEIYQIRLNTPTTIPVFGLM